MSGTFPLLALLMFVAGIGAHSALPQPTAICPRTPPRDAVPYDTAQWRAVAGRFRLIAYDTVNRRDWSPGGSLIELEPVDSVYDAELRSQEAARLRVFRNARPSPIPRLIGKARAENVVEWNGNLAFYNGVLADGCVRDCLDASPTFYRFTTQMANGYRGEWVNSMTGNTYVVDPKTGRRLSAPAGYFCVIRQEP